MKAKRCYMYGAMSGYGTYGTYGLGEIGSASGVKADIGPPFAAAPV